MKKVISSILFLLGSFNITQADILQIGPSVGISASYINLDTKLAKLYDPTLDFGYQFGAIGRLDLPFIYVQPELLFANSSAKYNLQNQEHTLRYMRLNTPIMFGTSVLGLIRIQAGPTFSLLISAEEDGVDIFTNYERITAGYQVGIGVDIYRLIIDLKYEGNLSKFGTKLGNIPVDHRASSYILSIGMNIL